MIAEYSTLDMFYNERPERRTSGEADFGVHWQEDHRTWPQWRVSYIQATGEVYAILLGGHVANGRRVDGPVRLFGVVPPDSVKDRGRDVYYRTLDRILDGWADPDITHHLLSWADARLKAHTAQGQPA